MAHQATGHGRPAAAEPLVVLADEYDVSESAGAGASSFDADVVAQAYALASAHPGRVGCGVPVPILPV